MYAINWERVARVETHPIRIAILEALAADNGRALSPAELARETEWTVSLLAYHLKELEKGGLVEIAGTRPVRGALEHFYRLVEGE